MNWSEFCLLCFVIGSAWSLATLLLGGLHAGHLVRGHGHRGGLHAHSRWSALVNPSAIAVFLAWFGGIGYLLSRYSGLFLWINVVISVAVGLAGAWCVACFLRALQAREKPLDPLDYEMVGVLGRVSAAVRPDGFGEVLYEREGVRRSVPARSDDGAPIERGREVIVTRYERGIAYVRTWEAMTE